MPSVSDPVDPVSPDKEKGTSTRGMGAVESSFVDFFNLIQQRAHQNAVDHGFWEDDRPMGVTIALVHSELSEWLEGDRHGNPPDAHCPEFTSSEVETADAIIRIMDVAGRNKWRVAEALIAKMKFNAGRPHKHGKKF